MKIKRISFTALISVFGFYVPIAPFLPASALVQESRRQNPPLTPPRRGTGGSLDENILPLADESKFFPVACCLLPVAYFQENEQILQKMRSLFQTSPATLELDLELKALALKHAQAGRNEQALKIADTILYPAIRPSIYATLGANYAKLGQQEQSEKLFAQAVEITRDFLSNEFFKPDQALLLGEIALHYSEAGKQEQADNLLSEALELGESIPYSENSYSISILTGNIQNRATVLAEIAQRYAETQQLAKSEEVFSLALKTIQPEKNANSKAETLVEIAQRHAQAGQSEAAVEVFFQAFQTTQTMIDGPAKGRVLALIAVRQFKAGQLTDRFQPTLLTKDILAQAVQVANGISKPALKVQTIAHIAVAYANAGEAEEGLALLQSLKTDSDFDILWKVQALTAIATEYAKGGEEKKAVSVFSEAVTTAQTIQIRQAQSLARSNIAVQYAIAGQIERGMEVARTIEIEQYQKKGLWDQIAVAAVRAQQYEPALTITQHALNLVEANQLSLQGMKQFSQGEYQGALESMENALNQYRQLQEPQGEKATLAILGDIYTALASYPQAIESYQQSLALAKTLSDREGEAEILTHLGYALLQVDQYPEAIELLREGIALRESAQAGGDYTIKTYGFSQKYAYEWLQTALIAQKQVGAALEVAEQSRQGLLGELLADQLSNQKIDAPSIQQFQQIAQERQATIVEYSILHKPAATLGKYWLLGAESGIEETSSLLPTAAILIWVIPPNGELTVRRVDFQPFEQQQIDSLENLVALSRDTLGVRGRAVISVAASENSEPPEAAAANLKLQQLHQLLIQPIADLLPQDPNQQIIFIPDDSLFLVPFPALKDASGKYLIESHTLTTAPSINILALTRQQQERVEGLSGDALVIGNPTMPLVKIRGVSEATPALENATQEQQASNPQGIRLAPLPGAELEAQIIAQLLGTQPLIGSQAKETTVVERMPRAKIIHFATHGLLDEFVRNITGVVTDDGVEQITDLDSDDTTRIQEPGGIALAPVNSEIIAVQYPQGEADGLLTSLEIQQLKLNSELVVLSACNTGGGDIVGDGVVGLSRSFIIAGVPSVIVSLWAVPDAPTAELMTEFYRQLQQNSNKAQALRNAMLLTKEKHPRPLDWAAFTLVGEP
ncbi:MAG: CHAT domain-containing protein [Symploca sp. SIO2D2]|nr:CHAT domain-containing protein [Symploca sp. SIO2D2]